jgi:hypothetical protein
LTAFKQPEAFSRRDSPEVCAYFRVLEMRGRRESRMPAASDGLVRKKGRRRTSIAVTTGSADIRLSLHDERYGLCLMCSGQPAASPVTTAFALRLTVRPDGFINARLGAMAPAHFGFAVRVLSWPSCRPATDRFIRDRVPRPRDQTDMPRAVRVHRDPARASDDGQRPSLAGTIRVIH